MRPALEITTAGHEQSIKARTYAGVGLALLAILMPGLYLLIGNISAASVGRIFGETMGTLAFVGLISWVVTRKSSAIKQANGRVVVGLLLVTMVSNNLYKLHNQEDDARILVNKSKAFQLKQEADFADFAKRFDKVDLSKVLTPDSITTAAGQSTARALLADYKSLLVERRALIAKNLDDTRQFLQSNSGTLSESALSGFERGKTRTTKFYDELDVLQNAYADKVLKLVDFTATQGDKIIARSGKLVFASPSQLNSFNEIVRDITKTEAELNEKQQVGTEAQKNAEAENARFGNHLR